MPLLVNERDVPQVHAEMLCAFTEAELLGLNALYKSRWPSMEN